MADSGAILMTLAPFPLHNDLTPPSRSIILNPCTIPNLFVELAWTWNDVITFINLFNNSWLFRQPDYLMWSCGWIWTTQWNTWVWEVIWNTQCVVCHWGFQTFENHQNTLLWPCPFKCFLMFEKLMKQSHLCF